MMTTDADAPTVDQADQAQSFNVEAEQIVIGCLLIAGDGPSPDVWIDRVKDILNPDDFYRPHHTEIYQAILGQHETRQPFGPAAVAHRLAEQKRLAKVGGGPYLHTCIAKAPNVGQIDYYRDLVIECARRRSLQEGGVKLTHAAATGMSADRLAELAMELAQKAQARNTGRAPDLVTLGSLINPALDDIKGRQAKPKGIPTGYEELDKMTGGMRRKELTLLAGATGMGKSIALVDICRQVAIRLGLTVALFTLEMSKEEVFDRVLSAESGVPHHLIRDGLPEDAPEWSRIDARIGRMANAPFYVSDRSPMRMADIERCCHQLMRTPAGLDLVAIDHLHLVHPSSPRITDPNQKIADVSTSAKGLAMSTDLPVIAAAQFNRAPAARMDKTPQLTDLRGAANLEQDANRIILVHRPDYYDHDSPRRGEVDLILAKDRSGATGVVTLAAQLYLSRFQNMATL
ncbi:DnaB-like helicase C-terminal domain-containing protein [Micromonospora sp. NPDC006766]|uniref:replicative DNA helicase n=1 Tax=Micromonospora sp. NPDC006766 TaxID=3154778 RepID=UPI0033E80303